MMLGVESTHCVLTNHTKEVMTDNSFHGGCSPDSLE
jgi:hypothetical protein